MCGSSSRQFLFIQTASVAIKHNMAGWCGRVGNGRNLNTSPSWLRWACRTHLLKNVSYTVSFTNLPHEALPLFTGEAPNAQRGSVICPRSQKCRDYNVGVSDPSTADDGVMGKQQHWELSWDHKQASALNQEPVVMCLTWGKGWMMYVSGCATYDCPWLLTFFCYWHFHVFLSCSLNWTNSSWRRGLPCVSLASHLTPITCRSPSAKR